MPDGKPSKTLSDLLDEFSKWDEERRAAEEARSRVTTPLYHYCDMSSLVGIVTSKQLWLSSIWHLNDPSELKFGFRLARNCALERFTELPGSTIVGFAGRSPINLRAAPSLTRTRGSQIVSYVPITFPLHETGVLRRVLIGPAAIGNAERGVADLLQANGINPADKVERSTIPYTPR